MTNQTLSLVLLLLLSCTSAPIVEIPASDPGIPLSKGVWRLVLDLEGDELPINLTVRSESGLKVDFHNADEVITAYEYEQSGDSLYIRMPLFDSEFCGVVSEENDSYTGVWRNYSKGSDYSIPFSANHGQDYRFCPSTSLSEDVSIAPKWEVHFSPDSEENHHTAVGMFEQSAVNGRLTGTFMTETGDYRFLEGNICGNQFLLSCFDGSHAFLFRAEWDGVKLSNGQFKSGTHWTEPWSAVTNIGFELRSPDFLTSVVDSSQVWSTSMSDAKGNRKMLSEMGLENKVVIVQAMGSWCPNCVDESRDYKAFYERWNGEGLEVIPVSFENTKDLTEANLIIEEFRSDLKLPYPVYYGGKKSKKTASEVFPCLDHVISFPTSMIIARDGTVRKVHTGFYGPSTNRYYELWLHDTELLIEQLLGES